MSSLAVLNGTYANVTSSAAASGTLAVLANSPSVAASSSDFPVFTTTYTYCAKAADATTVWEATYTIVEVVCAAPETWTVPAVPPCFVESTVSCNSEIQTITCPVAVAERATSVSIGGNGVTASAGAWAEATAVAGEGWFSAGASAEAEATADGEDWFSAGTSAGAEAKATSGASVEAEARATAVADGGACAIAAEATAEASAAVAIVADPAANYSSSLNTSASATTGSWVVTAGATSVKNSLALVGTAVLLIGPAR